MSNGIQIMYPFYFGGEAMSVFRIEKNKDYTVISNHHLRDKNLSYKVNIYYHLCYHCLMIGITQLMA